MSGTENIILLFVLFILFLAAFLLRAYFKKTQPDELVNQDLTDGDIPSKGFYSSKYHIGGRPDEIKIIDGVRIPVEVKRMVVKDRAYPGHTLQLAAYCLLLEEHYGRRPPYGILQYSNRQFEIPYTRELQKSLMTQIKKIRKENPEENDLPPVCDNMRKCSHCGYNYLCHTGQKRLL